MRPCPRRRKRPILKWSATIAAVVALALTVATFWYDFMLHGRGVFVGACVGQLRVVHAGTAGQAWGAHIERPPGLKSEGPAKDRAAASLGRRGGLKGGGSGEELREARRREMAKRAAGVRWRKKN